MPQRDVEELVRSHAVSVTNGFLQAAAKAHNEAEFRTEAAKVIEHFAGEAGLQLHLREEYTLFNGKADAVYNRFVIEYEPPTSLRQENSYRPNQHAIDQVKRYMTDLARRERHKEERLAGVAFDGGRYIFVRRKEGVWYIEDPLEVKPQATERFLRMLCSLSTERALISENLIEDFGERTQIGRQVVSALYGALTDSTVPRVKVLFDQWSRQFSEVCDYDQASKVDVAGIAREYGIAEKNVDPFRLFFCIHSYYALLIKLLAVQITHFYLAPRLGTDLHQAANLSAEDLRSYVKRMEAGGLFTELGIKNFLEGDFFGWYLDCWSPPVDAGVRRIVGTLADYSLVTLDVDPDATRDLLKHLYQHLMPKMLRHNLGEYYTPDWLAERLLHMLEAGHFEGNPKKRLLDPACGSGTFLVLTIKAIRQYGWKHSIAERDLLDMILENVIGFDLNPLAVISARTNYLLALGDLLQHRRGDITVPVYLCDSILTPSESADLLDHGVHSFNTAVGPFAVPSSLIAARYIDRLATLLEESVTIHRTPDEFAAKAAEAFPIDPKKDAREVATLRDLYGKLLDLDAKGVNGVWARIIKNAFAPLFVGQFDYVAGNPPWVNWEHLPEQYRQAIAPLWQKYNLFTHKGLRARLGSAKDDISVLMFYVSADRYLKQSGRIGFVITQTVFKTEGGGEGFRRFRLGHDGQHLRVFWLDDMSELQPFEGATNQTAIVLAEKGWPTKYPVSVGYWRKRKRSSLPQSAELREVISDICRMSQWKAEPIDDNNTSSPWITGKGKAIRAVKRIVAPSDYRARAGVCSWLNSVYWVEVVTERPDGLLLIANCAEIGKKKQQSVQAAVEPDCVYALIRAGDVRRWRAQCTFSTILPHRHEDLSKPIPEDEMRRLYPRTFAYLATFKTELLERSGYVKYLAPNGAPFYAVYDVGPYTAATWKVVWPQMYPIFRAAVVGKTRVCAGQRASNRAPVPQHIVSFVSAETDEEAHYLCALINSAVSSFCNASYGTGKSYGIPSVLKRLAIRKFNPDNALHMELSLASQGAHAGAEKEDQQNIAACEEKIDHLAAKVWGLSREELKDIQDSLKDLME